MIESIGRGMKRLYAVLWIEWGLVLINGIGFLLGTLYWYGPQLASTPAYLWPWLVDSPLSVLGYAIALPLVRRQVKTMHWLATWAVFSNVKYGLWTVLFWSLWWQQGNPFTLESVAMTFTHGAMVLMGLSLLLFYTPTWQEVVLSAAWFGLNGYLDYWHGLVQTLPARVSVATLQQEQIAVTLGLTILLLMGSLTVRARIPAQRQAHHPS